MNLGVGFNPPKREQFIGVASGMREIKQTFFNCRSRDNNLINVPTVGETNGHNQ